MLIALVRFFVCKFFCFETWTLITIRITITKNTRWFQRFPYFPQYTPTSYLLLPWFISFFLFDYKPLKRSLPQQIQVLASYFVFRVRICAFLGFKFNHNFVVFCCGVQLFAVQNVAFCKLFSVHLFWKK
jgi:hypothetical protein